MSYILEALKKSDKERQRDEIPNLQADHSLPPSGREERKPPIRRIPKVAVFGVLCLIGGIWWLFSADPPVTVTETPMEKIPVASSLETPPKEVRPIPEKIVEAPPVVKKKPIRKELQQIVPREKPSSAPVAVVVKKKPVSPPGSAPAKKVTLAAPAPKTEESLPPLIEDLPVAIRAGIPDLTFVGHVYSEMARKRLIIINNRIVREGDLVSSGLSLKQIDPDGVVLQYERSVFRVKLF